ncbi:MAG: hypothetical protein R2799_15745 [Crocinitomicaceae bacterium]|nr:hypothetical protein [Crocinitomicaceae bacterium]
MKKLLFIFLMLGVGLFTSCKNCKNEDPRAKITNNGTQVVSVQIQTSGGNTININNIQPGTGSDWQSYAPGTVTYNVDIGQGGGSVTKTITMDMAECFEYEIVVDQNDSLVSYPKDRNEK